MVFETHLNHIADAYHCRYIIIIGRVLFFINTLYIVLPDVIVRILTGTNLLHSPRIVLSQNS